MGKSLDASGGFGPHRVTADALPPGSAGLQIESRLNGRAMQSASNSDRLFDLARTLALWSDCLMLEPGKVRVLGTPAGLGYARNPPVWLQAGDTIAIEIDGIGALRNPVRHSAGCPAPSVCGLP